jgi:hypothetical protein
MERLKGRAEPELVSIIAQIAEAQYQIDKGMGEIVLMLEQMMRINVGMVGVAGRMKEVIEGARPEQDPEAINTHDS